MNLEEQLSLPDTEYALLFDVRRSVRYHDRRKMFFERMHQTTAALTILTAGSVLFDIAGAGPTPWWLTFIALSAALTSVADLVAGFAKSANLHDTLKRKFADLELEIVGGPANGPEWENYQRKRLAIEQDEPPVYRALDRLCRNEQLRADGHKPDSPYYKKVPCVQALTAHFLHWSDAA